MEEIIKKKPYVRKRLPVKKLMRRFWEVAKGLGLDVPALRKEAYDICRMNVSEQERSLWPEDPSVCRGFHDRFFYYPVRERPGRPPAKKEVDIVIKEISQSEKKKTKKKTKTRKKRKKKDVKVVVEKKRMRKSSKFLSFVDRKEAAPVIDLKLPPEGERKSQTLIERGAFSFWSAKNMTDDLYAAKKRIDLARNPDLCHSKYVSDLDISIKLNMRPSANLPSVFSGTRSIKSERWESVFIVEWVHERYLNLNILHSDPELIDMFSLVLGFFPHSWCYEDFLGMLTFKWDFKHRDQDSATVKAFVIEAEEALLKAIEEDSGGMILPSKPKSRRPRKKEPQPSNAKKRRGKKAKSFVDVVAFKEEDVEAEVNNFFETVAEMII